MWNKKKGLSSLWVKQFGYICTVIHLVLLWSLMNSLLYVTFIFLDLGVHDIRVALLVKSDIAVVLGILLDTVNSCCSCTCCSPQRVNKNSFSLKRVRRDSHRKCYCFDF